MSHTVPGGDAPVAGPQGDAPAAPLRPVSSGYRGMVLGLLLTAYVFNFIDRTILGTIGQAVKEDLRVSDAQLGLLGGLYFALLYTLLGVPLARLAERRSRTWIITVSLVIWSAFTALSGAAHSFGQLALMRFGVGVGEAGLSPPAHSLISDFYEPRRRASALGVFSLGIPIGTMVGAVAGGWVAQHYGWRAAFVAVGLPGVVLAVVFRLLVREPARGASDPVAPRLLDDLEPPVVRGRGLGGELREIREVGRTLFGVPSVLHMMLGITLASFAGYGAGAFVQPHFIRSFGLNYAQVGLVYGLVAGLSAGVGTLMGGLLTDRLGRRSAAWYALTPAIGLLLACPLYILAFNQSNWVATALLLLPPGVSAYVYLAPTFAVVQNSVELRRRATATAILFLVLNLIALGGGPPITGWLIDRLGGWNFDHPGVHAVWTSLFGALGGRDGAAYAASCPGGIAPKGAGAAATAACRAALAVSTRQGITLVALVYGWAALHYFLGARGLAAHMAGRSAKG